MVEIGRVVQDQPEAGAAGGILRLLQLPGLVPYIPMWECQRVLAAFRARGDIDDLLVLLEHEHVYTNGRRGDRTHLLADEGTLARLGAAYHPVDRGGDMTYHGPGQLVGYPIIHLNEAGLSIRSYVRRLEQVIIRSVAAFGVIATTIPGYTGVWVGDRKLAAIGVRVSEGIAYHGFALNVSTDLSYFEQIIPCGITDRGVTALEQILGQHLAIDKVLRVCAEAFANAFERELRWMNVPAECAELPDQLRTVLTSGEFPVEIGMYSRALEDRINLAAS